MPVELVQPEPFDPGQTATFLARQRDTAGETAWRNLLIDNYRELGAELVRVREKANAATTALETKVSDAELSDFRAAVMAEVKTTLNRQWAFIVAVAAVYGAVIGFIAEKVFK
jgi:hypothetical protein